MFKQGLAQPTSDNNLTVHALMSVNIQLRVRLMCLLEVQVLLNQSTKDVKDSFLFSVFFLSLLLVPQVSNGENLQKRKA